MSHSSPRIVEFDGAGNVTATYVQSEGEPKGHSRVDVIVRCLDVNGKMHIVRFGLTASLATIGCEIVMAKRSRCLPASWIPSQCYT